MPDQLARRLVDEPAAGVRSSPDVVTHELPDQLTHELAGHV
jgi:hypothetical protein